MKMNEIVIEKDKLIPILKENKLKHDTIYEEAVKGYWVKAENILNEKLEKIKKHEQIDSYLRLSYPQNFSEEYDRALKILSLTSETKIVLSPNEFDSYVSNKWSWRDTFLTSATHYLTGCFTTSGAMF